MSDIEVSSESGANTESSANSETASPAQSQEAAPQQAAAEVVQKEQPFHEHPRFRELVEQKNQYQQQLSQMQQSYQQMQAQMQQLQQQYQTPKAKPPSHDELFRELEQVNPHFAKLQQEIYGKVPVVDELKGEVESLKEYIQQERQQRDAQQARSSFDKLCTDNKVSEADKFLYENTIANMANARKAAIKDLPGLFNEAHQQLSKYLNDRDRSQRESYVAQKTKDKTPASQTGGSPVGLPGKSAPQSTTDVKAAFVAALRAGKNV